MSRTHRRAALVALAPLLALPLAALLGAPEALRTGGTFTMTYTQQQVTPLGDVEGHIVIAAQAKGIAASTGKAPFMDGAEVRQVSLTELTQGSGPDQGYIIESKGGETSITRYTGSVKTVPTAEGKPSTTFEGTWTKVGGSGRYAGMTGAGSYTGRMRSETEYVVEWKGEVQLREAAGTP